MQKGKATYLLATVSSDLNQRMFLLIGANENSLPLSQGGDC